MKNRILVFASVLMTATVGYGPPSSAQDSPLIVPSDTATSLDCRRWNPPCRKGDPLPKPRPAPGGGGGIHNLPAPPGSVIDTYVVPDASIMDSFTPQTDRLKEFQMRFDRSLAIHQ